MDFGELLLLGRETGALARWTGPDVPVVGRAVNSARVRHLVLHFGDESAVADLRSRTAGFEVHLGLALVD
jgi:hypothetical protein